TTGPYKSSSEPGATRLAAVLVFEFALGQLFQCHRQVVALGVGLHHRGRVLAEATLTEVVEVTVDLPRPLRRHDNGGVMGVGVIQKLVYAWFDHRRLSLGHARGGPLRDGTSCVLRSRSIRRTGRSMTKLHACVCN